MGNKKKLMAKAHHASVARNRFLCYNIAKGSRSPVIGGVCHA